ncbi:phosphatidylglycerophosphatase A family protein [Nitratifractor sp.]
MSLNRLFLTLGGAGKLPAPFGLLLVALPLGLLLLLGLGAESLFSLAFALFIVGIFEVNRYEQSTGVHDAPEILLDDAVGLWIALVIGAHAPGLVPDLPYALPAAFLLSLAAFVLFERWRPSTIGWIGRNLKGGLGVMLDDVLAGFAAGMLTLLIFKGIEIFRQ